MLPSQRLTIVSDTNTTAAQRWLTNDWHRLAHGTTLGKSEILCPLVKVKLTNGGSKKVSIFKYETTR